jgi:large subunit ribosomal protein L21
MSKYAIIETGSKQIKVRKGDTVLVEKIDKQKGSKITFDKVLLFVDAKRITVGRPYLNQVIVHGKLEDQIKGKKIRIATFKAKSRYRRVKGHRQQVSKVVIQKIASKSKSTSKKTQASKSQ